MFGISVSVIISVMIVAFISAFLRGFQNKNIVAGYKGWTFCTGYLMGLLDAVAFTLIATSGVLVGIFYGLGMGAGFVSSLIVHKRLSKGREKLRKKKKRSKLGKNIEATVKEMLIEYDLIRKEKEDENADDATGV